MTQLLIKGLSEKSMIVGKIVGNHVISEKMKKRKSPETLRIQGIGQ